MIVYNRGQKRVYSAGKAVTLRRSQKTPPVGDGQVFQMGPRNSILMPARRGCVYDLDMAATKRVFDVYGSTVYEDKKNPVEYKGQRHSMLEEAFDPEANVYMRFSTEDYQGERLPYLARIGTRRPDSLPKETFWGDYWMLELPALFSTKGQESERLVLWTSDDFNRPNFSRTHALPFVSCASMDQLTGKQSWSDFTLHENYRSQGKAVGPIAADVVFEHFLKALAVKLEEGPVTGMFQQSQEAIRRMPVPGHLVDKTALLPLGGDAPKQLPG